MCFLKTRPFETPKMARLLARAFTSKSGRRRKTHRSAQKKREPPSSSIRKRHREAETGMDGRVQTGGERNDRPITQGDDVQLAQAKRGALVASKGQLAVCSQRTQAPWGSENTLRKEATDVLSALEPVRDGRHRESGVASKQLQKAPHVRLFPGRHEALDELALPRFPELAQGDLLTGRWDALLERPPRSLKGAVGGRNRRRELFGNLRGRETEHLSQDQHGALSRRKVLQRRDERQLHALQGLVSRERVGRIGLEPDRFADQIVQARVRRVGSAVVRREQPLRPLRDQLQAGIRRDAIQPRAKRAPAL